MTLARATEKPAGGLFRPALVRPLRPVALGRRSGGFFELRSGLEPGSRLVLSGAFTLKSALQRESLAGHEH